MAPNRAPNPEFDPDRRRVLQAAVAAGLAYVVDRATGGHGLRALEHAMGIGAEHEDSNPVESYDKTLSLENIDEIRSRAEELSKHTEESLADYILGAKHVSFDESTPRVKESMVWAKEEGVFPLVQPVGDIKKGLDDVSPNVPVQKPLLVLLALINDAAIDIKITSLSTSPEHVESSAHYEGRGCDISSTANNLAVMQFVRKMHDEGIVPMDELSAPHNPGKLGLNGGKPGDISEGDHMHLGTKELTKVKERFLSPSESNVFVDDDAKDVAEKLGVTPGTYFNIDQATGKTLREIGGGFAGLKDQEGAIADGIFPPSVMRWKDEIMAAAKKSGVSPNFIATIMTIESCGVEHAASSADAHGLIQVVPAYHRERIDRISKKHFKDGAAGDAARAKYLKDFPGKSVQIGADYLRELLDSARKARPDLDPEDPVVYMRAAAGYNGGPKNVAAKFAQWPLQSQLYANFVGAFYVDASVSNALKHKGNSPDEISNAMKSPAMTMRMRAFREIPKGGDYASFSRAYRMLESPSPGVKDGMITDMRTRTLVQLMAAGYMNSRTNKVAMVKPGLPPALTYWVAHGGGTSLEAAPGNRAWEDKLGQN